MGRAEAAVRALGFADLRVRHYGDLARLEVPLADLARVLERRAEVVAAVVGAGYAYVTLDLEGLRSGNLNAALAQRRLVRVTRRGCPGMESMSRSRLHLSFPEPLVERPVIYEAANRFGVMPNIRRANVETHSGWVILELTGEQQAIDEAVSWFAEVGVIVNRMEGDVLES